MNLRHRQILLTLEALGGKATITQIAEKTGLHPNGVSQSIGVLSQYASKGEGKGGGTMCTLIKSPPPAKRRSSRPFRRR